MRRSFMKPDVSSRSPVYRYGLALAAVAAALLLRWALASFIGPSLPYITIFPAVLVVVVSIGTGTAIVAMVIGMVLSDLLFTETGSQSVTVTLTVRRVFLVLTTLCVGWFGYIL